MKTSKFAFSIRVSPWLWSKISNLFIYRLVLGKFGLERVFGDFLDRKQAVLDLKNTDLNKPENLHLCKEVSPWFWSKIINFFNVSFKAHLA